MYKSRYSALVALISTIFNVERVYFYSSRMLTLLTEWRHWRGWNTPTRMAVCWCWSQRLFRMRLFLMSTQAHPLALFWLPHQVRKNSSLPKLLCTCQLLPRGYSLSKTVNHPLPFRNYYTNYTFHYGPGSFSLKQAFLTILDGYNFHEHALMSAIYFVQLLVGLTLIH